MDHFIHYSFCIMSDIISEFKNVTVQTKANIYFDGKVVSHSVEFDDGSKKTLGLIFPGDFHFGTDAPERMEIVAGNCVVKVDGSDDKVAYTEGQFFEVPGDSGFQILVSSGICEYLCSFID
tara:strand:+ start:850 stop:1212 length:363 start_codon:yes stop_codon:yes gene_type:complete